VSSGGHSWWEDAIVYQVYPRSFADSDGDGVGDLPGLRSRQGYLADPPQPVPGRAAAAA
jgi:alpha-glucosidase